MAFEIVEEKSPSLASQFPRHTARTVARGAESILGLPGDISSAVLGLGNYGIEKLTGSRPLPEKLAPTSEDLHEDVTKRIGRLLPEDYLEPQSRNEERSDELFSDLATLLIPIKGKIPFARALKTAGLGNIASFLGDKLGAPEGVKTSLKVGTMLLSNFQSPRGYKDFVGTLPKKEQATFWRELHQTSKIHDFLGKITDSLKLSPITASVLGSALGIPKKWIAGAYGLGLAERELKAFAKNPPLRKYYKEIINGALKQDIPLTLTAIKKFDTVASRDKENMGSGGEFEIID